MRIAHALLPALALTTLLAASPALATPLPVSGLTHTVVPGTRLSPGYVRLDWALEPTATHFDVFRNNVIVGSANNPSTGTPYFIDYAYPMPGDYVYAVTAVDGSGSSAAVTVPVDFPSARDARVEPMDWFHDTFPFSEDDALPGTAFFDTCSALIRTGRNIAQTTLTATRFDVPGDSVVVHETGVQVSRVDMVFRIKPGVGNYITFGVPSSGLRALPTSATPAGPGSFWGQYLSTPGDFATLGAGGVLDTSWPGGWNWNVWRSARCDTAEVGLFPVAARGAGDVGLVAGQLRANDWMSCYHESDPHYTTLGISKPKCFMIDTLGPVNSTNITCNSVPAWVTTTPASRTGWDGNATTIERTQIIPDGVLTPGAHVEYYFRIQDANGVVKLPDPAFVLQGSRAPGEGSVDGHRWQEFSVLPDLWKDVAVGGAGLASMLYVDVGDGRGDERVWKKAARSLGFTSPADDGNADGYINPVAGQTGISDAWDAPAEFVDDRNAQAGTAWDMFGVRGGGDPLAGNAGSIGSRLSYRDPSVLNLVDGKYSRIGPTEKMLNTYYRMILMTTGDLHTLPLGPDVDRSQDDVHMLEQFLDGSTLGSPRGLFAEGDAFAEALSVGPTAQQGLLTNYFGAGLLSGDYRAWAPNPSGNAWPGTLTYWPPYFFQVQLDDDADVLAANPSVTTAAVSGSLSGFPVPFVPAGPVQVHRAPAIGSFETLLDGFDPIRLSYPSPLLSFDHSNAHPATQEGAQQAEDWVATYYWAVFAHLFNGIAPTVVSSQTGDVPPATASGQALAFVALRGNPFHSGGDVGLEFDQGRAGRVATEVVDLQGRRVRAMAPLSLAPGRWTLRWDGRDDSGRLMAAGVYLFRLQELDTPGSLVHRVVLLP